MKRSVLVSLTIGLIVAAVVGLVHVTGILSRFELAATESVSHLESATRVIGKYWQLGLILLFAVGVSWITLTSSHRRRIWWLVGILLIEIVGIAWICSLYHVYIQPWPSIAAVALAFIGAESWRYLATRSRAHVVNALFAGRMSSKQVRSMIDGHIPVDTDPR